MKDRLEEIINHYYADSGLIDFDIEDIKVNDKLQVSLKFEKLNDCDLIRMLPSPNEFLNIIWTDDYLNIVQSVTKEFIDNYIFCQECNDTGHIRQIAVCRRAVSDCCGGCTEVVKCNCNNNK